MGGRSCRPGFTLLELLVVIAMIVLLIALVMPSLRSARASARMAHCESNLHQMAIGFKNLQLEGKRSVQAAIPTAWQAGLSDMSGGERRIFHCPEGGNSYGVFDGGVVGYVEILLYGVWRTHTFEPSYFVRVKAGDTFPSNHYTLEFESSHGNEGGGGDWDDLVLTLDHANGEVTVTMDAQGDLIGGVNNAHSNVGFRLFAPDGIMLYESDLSAHPDVPAVIGTYPDGGDQGFDYGMNNRADALDSQGDKVLIVDYTKLIASVVGPDALDIWQERAAPRHFDKLNVLFYGGHVLTMSPAEIDPEDDADNWAIHNELWKPYLDPPRQ